MYAYLVIADKMKDLNIPDHIIDQVFNMCMWDDFLGRCPICCAPVSEYEDKIWCDDCNISFYLDGNFEGVVKKVDKSDEDDNNSG
jgi:hypothetical protein